jgi:hypothetical protein
MKYLLALPGGVILTAIVMLIIQYGSILAVGL